MNESQKNESQRNESQRNESRSNESRKNKSWKNDPRLKGMDPEKLSLLLSFAKELETAPKNQKMAAFLSINQRAAEKHMSFSSKERELLISILTEGMSQEEKNRVELIKRLAAR